ncbi:PP2C family protein-serine/threonine phosphatase [Streptomyces sp. NBC_00239]|uniref:PP2C family protein-serine/threonine phosphatase n=1 Tax=Streptomyces sp. NBC_00239 TaxID=2903640 RepID=UPI002E28FD35|nr:PP2C family protein-serine/threonine phosphatase [Streptomyces sp. NBC_00239]
MTAQEPAPAAPGGLGPVLAWVLERSHGASALQLAGVIGEAARRLGIPRTRLYLADLQQQRLLPLPQPDLTAEERDGLDVDGSLGGLAYRTQAVQSTRDGDTTWFPMVDGIERIGVMQARAPGPHSGSAPAPGSGSGSGPGPGPGPGLLEAGRALASLATLLVVSKSTHHDPLVQGQRVRPMTLQAELLWAFLPPRTIGTDTATSSAVLEPAYDIGGDAFDHSFIDGVLHLTLVDAMGHDLASGGASGAALAACRATRRAGGDLPDIVATIDRTLAQWIPDRLMTAVIAELDTTQGDFTWINCGHPAPLLIREGHVLQNALERPAHLPLGFGFHAADPPEQEHVRLQPGDRVLIYSDGITEARSPTGDLFGEERLADTVIRSTASGANAPEALRRLVQNLLTHHRHRLRDDATILLVEWHPSPRAR